MRLINDDVLKKSIRENLLLVKCQKMIIEMVIDEQPTVEAIPIEYMQSQVDCGKWKEIIQRWREHEQTDK